MEPELLVDALLELGERRRRRIVARCCCGVGGQGVGPREGRQEVEILRDRQRERKRERETDRERETEG